LSASVQRISNPKIALSPNKANELNHELGKALNLCPTANLKHALIPHFLASKSEGY